MYSGPGLAWEQDEGLEFTDEEVERSYEEFYEDVHTEFLKFGEIINFKVCRNGSAHLRGNVYVHYKSLDAALLAYRSISGRYFAGKQVKCEFVGVTRWKVAICGEYMRTRFNTCSRGTACNFIHCFRNPGGDYEWADWDKPPPNYWVKKMSALFGYTDEYEGRRSPSQPRDTNSQKQTTPDADRHHHSRRSRSRDRDSSNFKSHRDRYKLDDPRDATRRQRHTNEGRRHVGRKKSKDTLDRDCLDTGKLKNHNRGHSCSRRSSEGQTRDEEFTGSSDNEVDTNRDRSSEEPHGNWASNRSKHDEVRLVRHFRGKVSRMGDSEVESDENGGSALDQAKDYDRYNSDSWCWSKNKDSIHCTIWNKGREETEDVVEDIDDQQHGHEVGERHKHQKQNRDGCKRGDKDRIAHQLRDRDRDVNKHREGEENGDKHQKKRRRSLEHVKESYRFSDVHADKKKKTRFFEINGDISDSNEQHQPNSPSNLKEVTVGIIDDRWVPE
uniref:Uncharacterized protein n=1 Tax=Kalanchoe fedtschenkoi TaxID=63787 RepID=A0A7N0RFW2_KALFE